MELNGWEKNSPEYKQEIERILKGKIMSMSMRDMDLIHDLDEDELGRLFNNDPAIRMMYLSKLRELPKHRPQWEKANMDAGKKHELTAYRQERNLLWYPFCSIAKGKRLKTIDYITPDGRRWLRVTANHEYGMAKIWDFDILRFAMSKAVEVERKTGHFPDGVMFYMHECLEALGKTNCKANYDWIKDGLKRLASTTYETNIFSEKAEKHYATINEALRDQKAGVRMFTLISCQIAESENIIIDRKIDIFFNWRLLESVRCNKQILVINKDVIGNQSPLKKRVMDIVTVGMGKSDQWEIRLTELFKRTAYFDPDKKQSEEMQFSEMKRTLKTMDLPWIKSYRKNELDEEIIIFMEAK